MKINKKLVNANFSSRNGEQIKYIVIHDTGNEQPLATAEAHYKYFSTPGRNASAHYFVDEVQILQIIEDSNSAWHVGDGKGKYGITNRNSIGIEICINDGDYSTEIAKTLELTKYLMEKYRIPPENVVRHYDASGKLCPAKLSANNWAKWHEFKAKLVGLDIEVDGKLLKSVDYVVRYDENGYPTNYISVRDYEEKQGHTVEWDKDKKLIRVVRNG